MEPVIRLVEQGKEEKGVVAHACGKCRAVRGAAVDARRCCGPARCSVCDVELPRNVFRFCDSCSAVASAKRNAKRAQDEFECFANAPDIISSAVWNQEMYEDAEDGISSDARAELKAFLDGWCKRNPVTSWQQGKRAVLLNSPECLDVRAGRQARTDAVRKGVTS